ncbi:hypothetical protein [Oscillibacter sp.]|uniref:hypothetical protein n=1 Tax=Oscillibacter sp. TaxID=1945593 RepID=UPI0028B2363A|nr:hypothetical protein [Oscillibacter sp.]
MNDQKNSDEIIRALRKDCSECSERSWCDHGTNAIGYYCPSMDAADRLESQQARIAELEGQLANARNELCQKCGRYHEAHKGACNGCRWKELQNVLSR